MVNPIVYVVGYCGVYIVAVLYHEGLIPEAERRVFHCGYLFGNALKTESFLFVAYGYFIAFGNGFVGKFAVLYICVNFLDRKSVV